MREPSSLISLVRCVASFVLTAESSACNNFEAYQKVGIAEYRLLVWGHFRNITHGVLEGKWLKKILARGRGFHDGIGGEAARELRSTDLELEERVDLLSMGCTELRGTGEA